MAGHYGYVHTQTVILGHEYPGGLLESMDN